MASGGCTRAERTAVEMADPQTVADEVVAELAAAREAIGGEGLGGWDLATDGSVEVLLARDDGFLMLLTVTDAKTSLTTTSACFADDVDPNPTDYLPATEPHVTVL